MAEKRTKGNSEITTAWMEDIEQWRILHGYTPQEMATVLGCSYKEYTKMLMGHSSMDMHSLRLLHAATGCRLSFGRTIL